MVGKDCRDDVLGWEIGCEEGKREERGVSCERLKGIRERKKSYCVG